jgi:hypothetical protein
MAKWESGTANNNGGAWDITAAAPTPVRFDKGSHPSLVNLQTGATVSFVRSLGDPQWSDQVVLEADVQALLVAAPALTPAAKLRFADRLREELLAIDRLKPADRDQRLAGLPGIVGGLISSSSTKPGTLADLALYGVG